ncbi:MAG: MATE family efflux transporter, partial [Candidatus Omnitrophica bacterium]|nr:MATE family efflux transporter [Candidatus Omnitrophota bacterium]
MLTKVVAWLVILCFTINTVCYGYDKTTFDRIRARESVSATKTVEETLGYSSEGKGKESNIVKGFIIVFFAVLVPFILLCYNHHFGKIILDNADRLYIAVDKEEFLLTAQSYYENLFRNFTFDIKTFLIDPAKDYSITAIHYIHNLKSTILLTSVMSGAALFLSAHCARFYHKLKKIEGRLYTIVFSAQFLVLSYGAMLNTSDKIRFYGVLDYIDGVSIGDLFIYSSIRIGLILILAIFTAFRLTALLKTRLVRPLIIIVSGVLAILFMPGAIPLIILAAVYAYKGRPFDKKDRPQSPTLLTFLIAALASLPFLGMAGPGNWWPVVGIGGATLILLGISGAAMILGFTAPGEGKDAPVTDSEWLDRICRDFPGCTRLECLEDEGFKQSDWTPELVYRLLGALRREQDILKAAFKKYYSSIGRPCPNLDKILQYNKIVLHIDGNSNPFSYYYKSNSFYVNLGCISFNAKAFISAVEQGGFLHEYIHKLTMDREPPSYAQTSYTQRIRPVCTFSHFFPADIGPFNFYDVVLPHNNFSKQTRFNAEVRVYADNVFDRELYLLELELAADRLMEDLHPGEIKRSLTSVDAPKPMEDGVDLIIAVYYEFLAQQFGDEATAQKFNRAIEELLSKFPSEKEDSPRYHLKEIRRKALRLFAKQYREQIKIDERFKDAYREARKAAYAHKKRPPTGPALRTFIVAALASLPFLGMAGPGNWWPVTGICGALVTIAGIFYRKPLFKFGRYIHEKLTEGAAGEDFSEILPLPFGRERQPFDPGDYAYEHPYKWFFISVAGPLGNIIIFLLSAESAIALWTLYPESMLAQAVAVILGTTSILNLGPLATFLPQGMQEGLLFDISDIIKRLSRRKKILLSPVIIPQTIPHELGHYLVAKTFGLKARFGMLSTRVGIKRWFSGDDRTNMLYAIRLLRERRLFGFIQRRYKTAPSGLTETQRAIPEPELSEVIPEVNSLLIITHTFDVAGGQEIYIQKLSQELAGKGIRVHILYATEDKDAKDGVDEDGIYHHPIWQRKLLSIRDDLRPSTYDSYKKKMDSILQNYSIDMINLHSVYRLPPVYAAWSAYRRGIPVVSVAHTSRRWRLNLSDIGSMLVVQLVKAISTKRLSVSDSAGKALGKGVRTVGSFTDLERFTPKKAKEKAKEFLAKYKEKIKDKKIILCPTRITPAKGQMDLLNIARRLKEERDDFIVVCAGRKDSHYVKKLNSFIKEHNLSDVVLIVDTILSYEEMPSIYGAAQMVVLPTYHPEGLPLVILEALACKKLVIAYDSGGVKDILVNGINGVVVPKGDTGRLYEKIAIYLDRPHLSTPLVEEGYELVHREFDLKRLTPGFMEAFREARREAGEEEKGLSNWPISKEILKLATPLFAWTGSMHIAKLIELVFVGILGPLAIGAAVMSESIVFALAIGLAMGLSTAGQSLVANFIGAGRKVEARRVIAQVIFIGTIVGLIIVGLTWTFGPSLLRLLGAGPELLALGIPYLKVMSIAMALNSLSWPIRTCLTGAGDSVRPMKIALLYSLFIIIMGPILIFGWGRGLFGLESLGLPFFGLGLVGAAWAGLFSRCLDLGLGLWVLFKNKSKKISLSFKDLRLDLGLIKRLVRKMGFFRFTQSEIELVSDLIFLRLVAIFGPLAVAAYGIGRRIWLFITIPCFGLSPTATTLVGQSLGAKEPDKAQRIGWVASGLYLMFTIIPAIFLFIFAPQLVAIFNSTPAVVNIGSTFLRFMVPVALLWGGGYVLSGGFWGAGDMKSPLRISTLTSVALKLTLSTFLALGAFSFGGLVFGGLGMGINGLWWGLLISISLYAGATVEWFRKGLWKRGAEDIETGNKREDSKEPKPQLAPRYRLISVIAGAVAGRLFMGDLIGPWAIYIITLVTSIIGHMIHELGHRIAIRRGWTDRNILRAGPIASLIAFEISFLLALFFSYFYPAATIFNIPYSVIFVIASGNYFVHALADEGALWRKDVRLPEIKARRVKPLRVPEGTLIRALEVIEDEFSEGPFMKSQFQPLRINSETKRPYSNTTIYAELNGLVALGILDIVDRKKRPYEYILTDAYRKAPPRIKKGIRSILETLHARPIDEELKDTKFQIYTLLAESEAIDILTMYKPGENTKEVYSRICAANELALESMITLLDSIMRPDEEMLETIPLELRSMISMPIDYKRLLKWMVHRELARLLSGQRSGMRYRIMFAEAIHHIKEAQGLKDRRQTGISLDRIGDWIILGNIFYAMGSWHKRYNPIRRYHMKSAIEAYKEALEIEPGHPAALSRWPEAVRKMGEIESAAEAAERAVSLLERELRLSDDEKYKTHIRSSIKGLLNCIGYCYMEAARRLTLDNIPPALQLRKPLSLEEYYRRGVKKFERIIDMCDEYGDLNGKNRALGGLVMLEGRLSTHYLRQREYKKSFTHLKCMFNLREKLPTRGSSITYAKAAGPYNEAVRMVVKELWEQVENIDPVSGAGIDWIRHIKEYIDELMPRLRLHEKQYPKLLRIWVILIKKVLTFDGVLKDGPFSTTGDGVSRIRAVFETLPAHSTNTQLDNARAKISILLGEDPYPGRGEFLEIPSDGILLQEEAGRLKKTVRDYFDRIESSPDQDVLNYSYHIESERVDIGEGLFCELVLNAARHEYDKKYRPAGEANEQLHTYKPDVMMGHAPNEFEKKCRLCNLILSHTIARLRFRGDDYLLIVNPSPHGEHSMLLVRVDPKPQRVTGNFITLFSGCIMALGEDYEGFYNDPFSAASLYHEHGQIRKVKTKDKDVAVTIYKNDRDKLGLSPIVKAGDTTIFEVSDWPAPSYWYKAGRPDELGSLSDKTFNEFHSIGMGCCLNVNFSNGRLNMVQLVRTVESDRPKALCPDPRYTDSWGRFSSLEALGWLVFLRPDAYKFMLRLYREDPEKFKKHVRESLAETFCPHETATPIIKKALYKYADRFAAVERTPLFNLSSVKKEVAKARSLKRPLSLISLDINNLGHIAAMVSYQAGKSVRNDMIVYIEEIIKELELDAVLLRSDHDKLYLLLHSVDNRQAMEIAKRIKETLKTRDFIYQDPLSAKLFDLNRIQIGDHITASVGVITYPEDVRSAKGLARNADLLTDYAKLYGIKNAVNYRDTFLTKGRPFSPGIKSILIATLFALLSGCAKEVTQGGGGSLVGLLPVMVLLGVYLVSFLGFSSPAEDSAQEEFTEASSQYGLRMMEYRPRLESEDHILERLRINMGRFFEEGRRGVVRFISKSYKSCLVAIQLGFNSPWPTRYSDAVHDYLLSRIHELEFEWKKKTKVDPFEYSYVIVRLPQPYIYKGIPIETIYIYPKSAGGEKRLQIYYEQAADDTRRYRDILSGAKSGIFNAYSGTLVLLNGKAASDFAKWFAEDADSIELIVPEERVQKIIQEEAAKVEEALKNARVRLQVFRKKLASTEKEVPTGDIREWGEARAFLEAITGLPEGEKDKLNDEFEEAIETRIAEWKKTFDAARRRREEEKRQR